MPAFHIMSEANKIIFSMVKVSKFYDKKAVLKDIYLSFFYGAKIGVLGLNGAGKSSLLRIIAGTDKDFNGEVVFSKGYSVGYLEQEPHLDETKTVQQIVEEAVQSTVDLLKEYEEINAKFAEPMDDDAMTRLSNARAKFRKSSITPTPGTSIRGLRWRWTRFAARRPTPSSAV